MEDTFVVIKRNTVKNTMEVDGVTVLTYKIDYPEFQGPRYRMSLSVINKFYQTKALEYQRYIERELYPAAVSQYHDSVKNGYPIMTYEALVTYRVTYQNNCIVSLYSDKYEYTGGAHGSTVRSAQTWNLQACRRLALNELFHCPAGYRTVIFREIKRQIEREPDIYFEDYETLMVQNFNEDNFYCTPTGIIIYYQQYEIAPYSSGIREFLIPYSGCVSDPKKTCFKGTR